MLTLILVILVTLVFVTSIVVNTYCVNRFRRKTSSTRKVNRIMQHALDLEHIVVLRVKMDKERIVNEYGTYLPNDGISLNEYMENVHEDDRLRLLKFLDNISMRRTTAYDCHYRIMLTHSDGTQKWHYVHNSAIADGRTIPYDVICTISDETGMINEKTQEEDLSRRYRSIFEHSVVGLAIYDENGMLMAANENMRTIMHMEGERDPYFFDVSLFFRQPFRDLMAPQELADFHFCTKIVIPERNLFSFIEFEIKPQLDDIGRLQHYSLVARDVTEERSFYMKNRDNDKEIVKINEEIKRYETELQYLMDKCDMRAWKVSFSSREVMIYKSLNYYENKMSFSELREYFLFNQDSVAEKFSHPEEVFNKPMSFVRRMRSIFHNTDELVWNNIDSIPLYDKDGNLEGCFGVIRNITPLIQAQEQLKEETMRANDSTKLKSVFMANMTHEIRTPLNSIVGFSDLLPMIDSPEEKREMIRVIMNNCDMLLRLINDILEISTMDGSAIIITPDDVDFAHVFDDLCESLQTRVQNPNVTFIKDNPYQSLMLKVDQRRIQQVITNFVTNAVKYTSEGHIKVGYRLEESDTWLYVYCEDTGVGIPKDKQTSVFERFVKLNDYVQGTGLGLSICKAIAVRYNGKIGVESEGEGKGSLFWLRVPLKTNK